MTGPESSGPSPAVPWYARGLRFACRRSGACCTGAPGIVLFTPAELARMADHLGLLPHEFRRRFARRVEGRWCLVEVERDGVHDCVFLRRGDDGEASCSIHPVRPEQCRTWPFWPENLEDAQAWRRAARGCAGMRAGLSGEGPRHDRRAIEEARDRTPS